jgi:hypothetical protein
MCQKNSYFNSIMTIWGMKCLDPKSDYQNSNFWNPIYPLKTVLKTTAWQAQPVLQMKTMSQQIAKPRVVQGKTERRQNGT